MGRSETRAVGTALVTGGGKRIGRAIALALGRAGWNVAIHYNGSRREAETVAREVRAMGRVAAAVGADLAREKDVTGLIAKAALTVGPLTCLVNNASVFERDEALTTTRKGWDRHMEVNLRAPFVLIQNFARQCPRGYEGNVINLIDERVWNLTPHFVSYTLSKSGLWSLTRTLALALAPRIRVNGIGPGPTLPSPRQSVAQFRRQCAMMPLGRGTTPDEVANAVLFILSARAMTGQMIALDGGQHLAWSQPGERSNPKE